MKAENAGKEKKMKSGFVLAVAVALLVVLAAPAAAQPAMRVEVPFAFTAGSQLLPAGTYELRIDLSHGLAIIVPEGGGPIRIATLAQGADYRKLSQVEKGRLEFEKYGDRYVLSAIWRPGSTAGKTVTGKRPPRELARAVVVTP
jgi:hypothetical protein